MPTRTTSPPSATQLKPSLNGMHVACRWTLVVGELDLHGEEREKLVEKAMSSVRLDGFSEKNIKHGNFGKQFR